MLGPAQDFTATLGSSQVTLSWRYLTGVTQWTLQRSADGGKTFTTVDTIANLKTEPEWVESSQRFVYVDADGEAGYLYALRLTDGLNAGVPAIAVTAPSPAFVTIFGYLMGMVGNQDVEDFERRVTISLVDEATQTQAFSGAKPAVVNRHTTVYADATSGMWQAHLLPGVLVDVQIPAASTHKRVRVPEDASTVHAFADLTDESAYGKLP